MSAPNDPPPFHMRLATEVDTASIAAVIGAAIHRGAAAHYNRAKRWAWAARAADCTALSQRLSGQITLVAETAGAGLVGVMTLGREGHLDLAYVHPVAGRRGIGTALHDRLIGLAADLRLPILTTGASRVAQPFFTRLGWVTVAPQPVVVYGLTLDRYEMRKTLGPYPSQRS